MSKFELIENDFKKLAEMNRKKLERQAANLDQALLVETIDLSSPDSNDEERQQLLAENSCSDYDEQGHYSSGPDSHSDEEGSQLEMVYRPVINSNLTLMTEKPAAVKWITLWMRLLKDSLLCGSARTFGYHSLGLLFEVNTI